MKTGGGNAGHNGLRSITAHVGNDYRRVRIGIGHPGDKELVHAYVLSDFAKSERPWVEALCDAIADNAAAAREGRGRELPEQGASRAWTPRASSTKRRADERDRGKESS